MSLQRFQAVRLSPGHPTVHAARSAVTDATRAECQALCGTLLTDDSLIGLSSPVTCSRCVASLRRRGIHEQLELGQEVR